MTPWTIEPDQRRSVSFSMWLLASQMVPVVDDLATTPAPSGMTMAVNLLLFATPLCESARSCAVTRLPLPPRLAPRA